MRQFGAALAVQSALRTVSESVPDRAVPDYTATQLATNCRFRFRAEMWAAARHFPRRPLCVQFAAVAVSPAISKR